MTQNIYDDEGFFRGYSRLLRSVEGLDAAPEWLALRALLPDLKGRRVLDLGCGFGWFYRWPRERGAAHVGGIDVYEKMLARAAEATRDPAIAYIRADMERLELPRAAFDLVFSSLALPLRRAPRSADLGRAFVARSGRELCALGGAPGLYRTFRAGRVHQFCWPESLAGGPLS